MFKAFLIFVHRFNLLFLFGFINCCIWCAQRLCYCCCPLAVCLDQLRLILQGVDWTLQMSAVMYWFLSSLVALCMCVCVCVCLFTCACVWMRARLSKTDGGGYLCLCGKWVDLIYTSLLTQQGRASALLMHLLLISFLFLSQLPQIRTSHSVSIILWCKESNSCLIFHWVLSLHYNCLSLSIFARRPIHCQFLSLAVFYHSVHFHSAIIHSESVLMSFSFTLCPKLHSISISSCFFHCLSACIHGATYQNGEL